MAFDPVDTRFAIVNEDTVTIIRVGCLRSCRAIGDDLYTVASISRYHVRDVQPRGKLARDGVVAIRRNRAQQPVMMSRRLAFGDDNGSLMDGLKTCP